MSARALVVTGATGRIGRLLRSLWPQDGTVWLDRRTWNMEAEDDPLITIPQGAVILHLAAVTQGPPEAFGTNITLARALARQADRAGHVLFASTAAVCAPGPGDVTEDQPPAPTNPYGASKLAAEDVIRAAMPDRLTILRIGNIAGADALLSRADPAVPVQLDPVPGRGGGPVRSYIGPHALAAVLLRLAKLAESDIALPLCLNVALSPPVAMADLLNAAGQPWRYGPVNPGVMPRVGLCTRRLAALVDLPPGDAAAIVADWRMLKGGWP